MGNDATPDLIRLADMTQSVAVRMHLEQSSQERIAIPGYCPAEILIESNFVSAQVGIHVTAGDIEEWARVLDQVERAEEADGEESLWWDWPSAGRGAYLRFVADDPYVVEVHDSSQTQIVVSVPLDMPDGWIVAARERLTAVQKRLGR
jgi:hypothetical protein